MNVLVIGNGGREHALCWALSKSEGLDALFCAPGNAGIAAVAQCVSLKWENESAIRVFCRDHDISLVVIGPEAPLAAGLADKLRVAGLQVVGPGAEAARLESSKVFMREICVEKNIPAPRHAYFANSENAKSYVEAAFTEHESVVVKADGLAAGKGVVIASGRQKAYGAIDDLIDGRFGAATSRVLIEEFLHGEEASLFFLCDGEEALAFGEARDFKRVGDGDMGSNTGGMGAYSPVGNISDEMRQVVSRKIVAPALQAMSERGAPFRGFLYAGVMLTESGVKLLEFNVRMGDPETQVVLPRLRSDFLELMLTSSSDSGGLRHHKLEWDEQTCLTVVLASRGYPGYYKMGDIIHGTDEAQSLEDVEVFHAGTARDGEGRLVVSGGRVLAVTGLGEDLESARRRVYDAVDGIDWPGRMYRRDIGMKGCGSQSGSPSV